jgi:hypothetical protein
MSAEYAVSIDLSELKAIKLQCPQCRASVAFPIARIQALSIPAACPGCSAEWRGGSHEIEVSLNNIVHALNTWRRVESDLKPVFELRFEMSALGVDRLIPLGHSLDS